MPLAPEKFRAAIRKAGFETRDFELSLQAVVERRGETYQLRPAGVAQQFAVRPGRLADELEHFVGRRVRARARIAAESPAMELELIAVEAPGA